MSESVRGSTQGWPEHVLSGPVLDRCPWRDERSSQGPWAASNRRKDRAHAGLLPREPLLPLPQGSPRQGVPPNPAAAIPEPTPAVPGLSQPIPCTRSLPVAVSWVSHTGNSWASSAVCLGTQSPSAEVSFRVCATLFTNLLTFSFCFIGKGSYSEG